MHMSPIATDNYQRSAEKSLELLAELKHQQRVLEADIKALQERLTTHVLAGDLDHLRTDAENTYKYDEINFVFNTGRVTYDFSKIEEINETESCLKELKSTAIAAGVVDPKVGKPFWTVRA